MQNLKRERIQVKLPFFDLFIYLSFAFTDLPSCFSLTLSLSSTCFVSPSLSLQKIPNFASQSHYIHPHPQVSSYRSAERAKQRKYYIQKAVLNKLVPWGHLYIYREREDLDQRRKDSREDEQQHEWAAVRRHDIYQGFCRRVGMGDSERNHGEVL